MTRPKRLRRCQLAVPGSNEKMITKAVASNADHVFCDLEDAVTPAAKPQARSIICDALNHLDWGKTVRSVRVNDVSTEWCHEDIITVVEQAGKNLDTIILPKPKNAADVLFADTLLTQLEKKLKLPHVIGLEVLIEEVAAMQNIVEISQSCARLEAMIFGMLDYSASQHIVTENIFGEAAETGWRYPGDSFHYPRYKMTIAAHAAGIDPIDGPFAIIHDDATYRDECKRALTLGMVGKWAIHPAQISPALEIFSPTQEAVRFAREVMEVYRQAQADGVGAISHKGMFIDAASARLHKNIIDRADLIGM